MLDNVVYISILDKDNNYCPKELMTKITNFSKAEKLVARIGKPVCIKWCRLSDVQGGWWSPEGPCLEPYWYNV